MTEHRNFDSYPTPAWAVRRLLERVEFPQDGPWLEPCAGEGHIIRAAREAGIQAPWAAIEVRPECRPHLEWSGAAQVEIGDLFSVLPTARCVRVALTNPPFSLAFRVVQRLLQVADYVAVLLREQILETETRARFFRENMPDSYLVPNRISFQADGKVDRWAYAWFVWTPDRDAGEPRTWGRREILAATPRRERTAPKSET